MNPKWILCDKGWKQLYDKLSASNEPIVQESMNTWYPQNIQQRLYDISTKYPEGFVQHNDNGIKQDSGVSVDLALLELNRYFVRQTCCKKFKDALHKDSGSLGANSPNPTLFSTTFQMLQIGREAEEKANGVIHEEDHEYDEEDHGYVEGSARVTEAEDEVNGVIHEEDHEYDEGIARST